MVIACEATKKPKKQGSQTSRTFFFQLQGQTVKNRIQVDTDAKSKIEL